MISKVHVVNGSIDGRMVGWHRHLQYRRQPLRAVSHACLWNWFGCLVDCVIDVNGVYMVWLGMAGVVALLTWRGGDKRRAHNSLKNTVVVGSGAGVVL